MFALAFTGEVTNLSFSSDVSIVTAHAAQDLVRQIGDAEQTARDAAQARRLKARRLARQRARMRWLRGHFVWPVKGPITSRFGWRRSPITGGREFHGGTDLACHRGGVLRAPKAGRVVAARYMFVYGRAVQIRHKGGWVSFLSHMSRLHVRKGMRVRQWQVIGRCGASGWATGPHVHFELRSPVGSRRDPVRFVWPPKGWRWRATQAPRTPGVRPETTSLRSSGRSAASERAGGR